MHVPLLESILHRAPWLIIGLFGVIVAAGIIDQFEYVLDKHIIFAFFIPAILYMSNALGTQNQTLLIRDFALMGKELNIGKYVLKTMVISAVVSAVISILVYGATSLIWNENTAGGVIALAMFITLIISSAISLTTTIIFKKMKQDPALGSGPFATIISDVSSILIYFLIVSTLL
jgi:magnesium transporter